MNTKELVKELRICIRKKHFTCEKGEYLLKEAIKKLSSPGYKDEM